MEAIRADPAHALVVGAGPGIGAAVARRFAREGVGLTLVARDGDRLAAIAGGLRAGGADVRTVCADAGDAHALRAALAPVVAADPPGVLVYNASRLDPGDLLDSDGQGLVDAYAVNVVGAIVAAQLCVPAMRAAGAGTILFTGAEPGAGFGTLALGKQSLHAVAAILAEQLRDVGVHVAYATVGSTAGSDAVADAYWALHRAPSETWRAEYRLDG